MSDPPLAFWKSAQRGVIETSVFIDLEKLDTSQLPNEIAVSAITMAKLAAKPHPLTTQTSGHADRTDSSAAKPPSIPYLSTEKQRVPTVGSTPTRSPMDARLGVVDRWTY